MNASTRINTTTRIGALALIGAATVLPALPAFANDADVIRTGSCSGASDWKVKASPENGRIEVEGEIDSNVVGQTWNWALRHNGTLSARGTKTTQAPSGSFEVRRVQNNLAGPDTFVFRAVNPASGEVCRGSVTF
jgi:hypothetical protein